MGTNRDAIKLCTVDVIFSGTGIGFFTNCNYCKSSNSMNLISPIKTIPESFICFNSFISNFNSNLKFGWVIEIGENKMKDMDQVITDNQSQYEDSIAVVGMSCRFPGANNPAEYWKLMSEGREAIRKFPSERPFYGKPEAREMQAGFLSCAVDEFDAKFFGISPREAILVDPQQRLLLEVTWECLEHAGINPQTLRESDTGVYVGLWQQDYERIIMESMRDEDEKGTTDFLHVFLGNKYSATASRISFCLGLHGPAVAVEAGCSSSLTGLHLACESLHRGEISLALVSGVNLVLLPFNPFSGKADDESGVVLSRDYRCKTFDESADGFVRAEGCGVVALKRFKDAQRDGDNILAIIKGSAVNNDGTGTSFGTPNEKAQERVYRAALKRAKVTPAQVSYVEAHGAGTAVGDPIEMYAVGQAYSEGRTEPLLVGSVKTNIGHCEAAAGMAGLIKVILCLEHSAIPPHRNMKTLNPRINLDRIPARIPLELTPWKEATKIAAVSSFSMSATNAHVILQEPPNPSKLKNGLVGTNVVTLSAKSEEALGELRQKYIEFLESNQAVPLGHIEYMTNVGRAHLQYRIAVVASDTPDLLSNLKKQNFNQGKAPTQKVKVGFLFPGQGSQYFGMTSGLCEAFPAFERAMLECDALFQQYLSESLLNVLFKDESLLEQTRFCQPSIFSVEYCLVQLWKFFGVKPDFVLGHSVGEFAAAVCAGVLTLQDAMKLVAERSQLVNLLPEGSMLAIRGPEQQILKLIDSFTKEYKSVDAWIDIAAVNSAEEIVVSVNSKCVKLLEDFCVKTGTKYVRIPSTHAFHSRDMDPILKDFGKVAESIEARNPNCTYVSGTLGRCMEAVEFSGEYWQRHLRDTVRFSEAVQVIWTNCKSLVEVGPQPTLLSLAMANVEDADGNGLFCPSQRRNEGAATSFYTAIRKLYVSGIDFDWKSVYGSRQKSVHLPTYPFQRQKYWVVDEAAREQELDPILHPLLGKKFPSSRSEELFYHMLRLHQLRYMEDHKVADHVVVPAAAFLEIFLAAGREVLHGGSTSKFTITIENFQIEAALALEKKCRIETQITSAKSSLEDSGILKYSLTLSRKLEQHFDKWKRHATAEITPSSKLPSFSSVDLEALKSRLSHKKSLETSYKAISELGIQFGPTFQSIASAWYGPNDILAEIPLPARHEDYICHPIILDAMIQTSAFREHLSGAEDVKRVLYLPVSIRKFTWLSGNRSNTVFAHCTKENSAVTLYNADGEALAIMEGLELIQTTVHSILRSIRENSQEIPDFFCETWRPVLGKLDTRVDISKMVTVSADTPKVKARKEQDAFDGLSPEKIQEYTDAINNVMFTSFCRSMHDSQWDWPANGEILYLENWQALLPKSINKGVAGIFMYEFENRGYLEEISSTEYRVLKQLPIPAEADKIVEEIRAKLHKDSKWDGELAFGRRQETCLPLVFQGKMTPLQHLFPEDESEGGALFFYRNAYCYRYQNQLITTFLSETIAEYQNAGSKDGVLRILEVGAGSASTTTKVIECLKELRVNYSYSFTDISPLFINEAKKTLGQGSEMIYQLLNIEQDPLSQGFCPEEFDIIIGAQVVHATVNIDESLANLKKLLRVNGTLILGESFAAHPCHTFPYGMLDGWWRFQDFRLGSKLTALLSEKIWEDCLTRAGFDSFYSDPGIIMGAFAARNVSKDIYVPVPLMCTKKHWLVVDDNSSELGDALTPSFRDNNRAVIRTGASELASSLSPDMESLEGIIYLCTEHDGQNENISQTLMKMVTGLLNIIRTFEAVDKKLKEHTKIVVVTRGVYSIGDSEPGNPNGATLCGITKVLRSENPNLKICVIDLDPVPTSLESSQVFGQLWNQKEEFFVALRQDKTYVLRLTPAEKLSLSIELPKTDRYKFINPESGSFADIDIGPRSREEPQGDEVEVEVRASALNFRDLFMVMKPEGFELPDEKSLGTMDSIGLDVSGVVVSIGSSVTRFKIGDEVCGFAKHGALSSHTLVAETELMRMPSGMRFEEAATVPCAFVTAVVSLVEVAKITATDRVLIHVASGGVGLAAIQIVKNVGAEIYATAGNKRKRAYLRSLGIKYVYHSRDTSYGNGIERDTNGAGVTVALNSLTGPNFKETTLRVCSQGARFVEIAKIGIWQPDEVKSLRPDVQYTIVDLSLKDALKDGDAKSRSADVQNKIAEIEKQVAEGKYTGLPCVTFPFAKIRQAFTLFQKAKHIGKIVVKMPQCTISDAGKIEHKQELFNSKSSYLVTGGLGGIAVEVAKWMLSKGAETLVLVGRRPPSETVQGLIDQWNRKGSNVVVIQADISNYESCREVLESIKNFGLPPLRGIMHAAGVLSDGLLTQQTPESFDMVLRPKVYGGWNLHSLTLQHNLEFFVMFSSVSGIIGMIGQSNHGAANRFLDALANYRVSIGLPGISINWGGWSDVGVAAQLGRTAEDFSGMRMFTPAQGLAALEEIMTSAYTQVVVTVVTDWNLVKTFVCQGRYLDELNSGVQDDKKFAQFDYLIEEIKQATSLEERQAKIQIYMEAVIKETLSLPAAEVLDIDQNFTTLGVDSLMAMEMKNRFQGLLENRNLSISAMQENRTIRSLSAHIAQLMENEPVVDTRPIAELINEDIILPDSVRATEIAATIPSTFKRILLTGATGYLGIHCLAQLLQSSKDLVVYCLIRAKSDEEAKEKLDATLLHYGISVKNVDNIEAVAGDISKPRLGLSDEKYVELAEQIDAILHCAARIDHVNKYADMRPHNVRGVVNILDFACHIRTKSILAASSLPCAIKVAESGILVEDYPDKDDLGEEICVDYFRSKYVGEKLLGEAQERGIPVKVIRYPLIFGNTITGQMPKGYSHLWSIITASIRVRMIPEGYINGLPLVAVDSAALVTANLFLNDSADLGIYNLTVGSTFSASIMKKILSEYGVHCELVTPEEWRDAVFEDLTASSAMSPVKSLYHDEQLELSLYSISRTRKTDVEKAEISQFSPKMLKNFPEIVKHVSSPEFVMRRQLGEYFNGKNTISS